MSDPTQRVIVLGGGFGGVYAAMHLERVFAMDLVQFATTRSNGASR